MEDEASQGVILSVHPRFGRAVAAGQKLAELRRVRPSISMGSWVVFYETAPTSAIVARARVAEVIDADARTLWRSVGVESTLDRDEFMAYFGLRGRGFAIRIEAAERCVPAIPLREVKALVPAFTPPQSYLYMRGARFEKLAIALESRSSWWTARRRRAG